jgi:hypothetical protein
MAYDMAGKEIYAQRRAELIKVENKNPKLNSALKYNYIRIELVHGNEKGLLFTDNDIKEAIYTANRNKEDLPSFGWFRETFLEPLIPDSISDLQKVINTEAYPTASKKYNHIIVIIENSLTHLLFTDNVLKRALKRAEKNPEDLPRVSWIMDILD